jgi:release factor glutamine methyltransferase
MSSSDATPEADRWTIGRLLNWTVDYFTQRGIESPRLDAEVLLAHARGCQRIMLYTAFDEIAADDLRAKFRNLVHQRAAGRPVAYLVGKREFYSLEFEVNPAVLIPRPETELLVVALLDWAKAHGPDGIKSPFAIADVGTGSGILAVCAARYLPRCHVTAIDVSPAAIEVARRNAARHRVEAQIEWCESDLFDELPDEATFDCIVSNPPYISTVEMEELSPMVREHEPRLALEAGLTGTEVIERLLSQAVHRLRPEGQIFIEISPMIAERTERLIDESPLERLPTLSDLDGRPRVVQARQGRGA